MNSPGLPHLSAITARAGLCAVSVSGSSGFHQSLSTGVASTAPSCQVVGRTMPSFAQKAGFGHMCLRVIFQALPSPLGDSSMLVFGSFPPCPSVYDIALSLPDY